MSVASYLGCGPRIASPVHDVVELLQMSGGDRVHFGHMVVRMSGRTRPSGFTLLEVMVALVLTGLVVVVAYTAAQAGIDARTRLTARLHDVQSARAAREILRDALRNARAPETPGDARGGFLLSNNTLSFVAAGGASPLDPDYDWRFTIMPDHGQVRVQAVAVGHAAPAQVSFAVPGVTRWTVWMLAADGATWKSEWSDPSVMPRAIVVAFWSRDRLVDWPLHLALWPGARPAGVDSLPATPAGDIRQPGLAGGVAWAGGDAGVDPMGSVHP